MVQRGRLRIQSHAGLRSLSLVCTGDPWASVLDCPGRPAASHSVSDCASEGKWVSSQPPLQTLLLPAQSLRPGDSKCTVQNPEVADTQGMFFFLF